jgi:hypothetical protein
VFDLERFLIDQVMPPDRKALSHDLALHHRRDVMKDVLEHALPATLRDVVVVSGQRDGRSIQETDANKIYSTEIRVIGPHWVVRCEC